MLLLFFSLCLLRFILSDWAIIMPWKLFTTFAVALHMKNVFLLYILLLVGCGSSIKNSAVQYDTLYAPTYASHFVVLSSGDSVVLRVNNPWQGAVGVSHDYPIGSWSRVVCMSSSHTAFLDQLGVGQRVVGVSSPDFFSNPRFAKLPDVGYDQNLNVELVASLRPDMITAYELSGENSSVIDKLSKFGVNPIYIADYLEDSPLARSEWVVAFGALSGRMDRGREIFAATADRYNRLRDSIDKLSIEPCAVMLNSPYKGVWYLPGDSSYIVRLITDAGGRYVASGHADNISRAVSTEVAYSKLLECDVWLNPSANINSIAQLRGESPLFSKISVPVFTNTAITGRGGGSDFWESGVVEPDAVLADLAKILHPSLFDGHKLRYHKQLK